MQASQAAAAELIHERLPGFFDDTADRLLVAGEARGCDHFFEVGEGVRHKLAFGSKKSRYWKDSQGAGVSLDGRVMTIVWKSVAVGVKVAVAEGVRLAVSVGVRVAVSVIVGVKVREAVGVLPRGVSEGGRGVHEGVRVGKAGLAVIVVTPGRGVFVPGNVAVAVGAGRMAFCARIRPMQ
jgi:hypothetical protein